VKEENRKDGGRGAGG
jgi:hypothetical protein